MKQRNPIKSVIFLLLSVILLLPVPVSAAGAVDVEAKSSLTISSTNNGTVLSGQEFELYYVAEVSPYSEFTLTSEFAQYPVQLDGLDQTGWREVSSVFAGYIQRDKIKALDSGKTDAQGILKFPQKQNSLKPGLYLVMGHSLTQEGTVFTTDPFMLSLPGLDEVKNQWNYDITVTPKYESAPEQTDMTVKRKVLKVWKDTGYEEKRPDGIVMNLLCDGAVYDTVTLNEQNNWRYTWKELDGSRSWSVVEQEPEDYTVTMKREGITFVVTNTYKKTDSTKNSSTPSTDTKLPQTGQLWWPVPFLVAAGLVLCLLGVIRRRGTSNEK